MYSQIAKPLTDLLAANTPYIWGSQQQHAFDSLKAALTSAPVLAFPDHKLPFVVGTDASDFAIGAVLQQDHGTGLQPLAFLSTKLNDAERNYPVHEKELLAIVRSIHQLGHHLRGAQHTIVVYTDHVTLRYFHNQPKISPRQVRWKELFADFDLDIRYKPGRENVVPDALSRRPDLKIMLCTMLNSCPLPDTDFLHRLRAALQKHELTKRLMKSVRTRPEASPAYRTLHGVLYYLEDRRYRLYISEDRSLKAQLLRDYHEAPASAHPGVHRTYNALKTRFYWPRMFEDIRSFIGSCRHCQLAEPSASPVAP